MATPTIRLSTLGRVSCKKGDNELSALTAQPRRVMLLVHLALAEPRGFRSRDQLLALFWPDHDDAHARNALSQAVHFLRRSLGAEALLSRPDDQLRVDPELISCDAIAFEEALSAGRTDEALSLYRGPFLDGFHITAAAAELNHWVDGQRDRLGRLFERTLRTVAQQREAAGDSAGAVVWRRRLVEMDPFSARAAVGLMRALAAAGESESALRHARLHERLIKEELQAAPDPEIMALVHELRRRQHHAAPVVNATSPIPRTAGDEVQVDAAADNDFVRSPLQTGRAAHRWPRRRRRRAAVAAALLLASTLAILPATTRRLGSVRAIDSGSPMQPGRPIQSGSAIQSAPPVQSAPSAHAAPRIQCIAVLPFENTSGDASLDGFAESLTGSMIAYLGHYPSPQSRSRASVEAFKGVHKALAEIGGALKCDGIVTGSVTRHGRLAHVDVEVLYSPEDRHLWAESYETDTSKLLQLERNINSKVAQHVLALAGIAPSVALPPSNRDSVAEQVAGSLHDALHSGIVRPALI
ncbi:MAG TPA: BTAD domain-containing putative transcriptional regulator [Gemmatimonadaceae bacterium]|jgi:DNA-binding SARP family transcriptional activator/TolB-like protein|nr:BTAD domain-containing putative transcriptional regulator [Gemmatimonadaceae bacterium]